MKAEQVRRSVGFLAVAFVLALGGCGGGGGGHDNNDDGGNGGANGFAPTGYVVFRAGEQAPLSGAGAVSDRSANQATLSLGGDGKTTLAVTDSDAFTMSASNTNYHVVNRRDGAVVMLCDPLPAGANPGATRTRYVAVATNSASAETQATPVTNALELAGKSFYVLGACSYLDDAFNVESQNDAPSGRTVEYRFDANGNLRGTDGWIVDAAKFSGFLNGNFHTDPQGRKVWFSAYKFTVDGEQEIYFATRAEPLNGDQGFASIWTDDPSSDVVGCSLNCAKPADAVAVASPAAAAGIWVTEFGFGEEVAFTWIDSAGRYSYGLGTHANDAQFKPGIELGTLSFAANGTASAIKTLDANGTGEDLIFSANASKLASTAAVDAGRHFVQERLERDAANPLIGAWALSSCGGNSVNASDPTQAFAIALFRSGRYAVLDSFGQVNNTVPTPGMEYGSYTQDSTARTFQFNSARYDTNADAGVWSASRNEQNGGVRSYSITPDGSTMTVTATGDGCGTATLVRIN